MKKYEIKWIHITPHMGEDVAVPQFTTVCANSEEEAEAEFFKYRPKYDSRKGKLAGYDILDIWEEGMKMKVIGSYPIGNAASINVYDIEYGIEDRVLVGYNNEEPTWETIQTNDEGEMGFCWGFWFIPFSMVERVL